jgi:hypothetical protein
MEIFLNLNKGNSGFPYLNRFIYGLLDIFTGVVMIAW